MPLDTSSYPLALLRLDGRRWNELRRIQASISSQPAADGSSYLEVGNTKIICTVSGPQEQKRSGPIGTHEKARLEIDINIAAFSLTDRKKRPRNDKRMTEMQHILASAFSEVIHTHLFPHSSIVISLHVLCSDGGILAALINAATLALIDAGIPMTSPIVACTAGSTVNHAFAKNQPRGRIPGLSALANEVDDPLLDLNASEEQDLPFLTVATVGESNSSQVVVCLSETRMMAQRLEEILAVGVDGCRMVRAILDATVQRHGRHILEL